MSITDRRRAAGKTGGGVGSAIPENQRLSGSKNPQRDADLAAGRLTEEDIQRIQEMTAEIDEAFKAGFPKEPVTDRNIKGIYQKVLAWKKEVVEDDLKEEAEKINFLYNVPPESPVYNQALDQRRRFLIEEKLEPVAFEDLVFKGYGDQTVYLRENFVVVFRTLTNMQTLWIEQVMAKYVEDQTNQFVSHLQSTFMVTCSIQSINGKPFFPDLSQYKKAGDREKFESALNEKFEKVNNMPQIILDDLIVNYMWFEGRLRKLMAGDILGDVGNS